VEDIALGTWSVAAADIDSGMLGVALASCVPEIHADGVAAIVPGKGVAVAQAQLSIENRNTVYEMLKAGRSASEIIEKVSNSDYDPDYGLRQYGVITLSGDGAEIATFSGEDIPPWFGSYSDENMGVTVQGNTLVGEAVARDAFEAYGGEGSFTDKLMAALAAGSAAGGDARCNNDEVIQTAATAFILASRADDAPYAAQDIGQTDMGTARAPWLCLSVRDFHFGENSVEKLKGLYDVWNGR